MVSAALRRCLLLALLACAGCMPEMRGPERPLRNEDYPGTLRPSEELPDGIFLRQRVTARYRDRSGSFGAVVETAEGRLRMLTLTPFGTRAFLIEQHGIDIDFTAYVDQPLPIPPRFMLLDLHRTMFLGSAEPPLHEGERRFERDGEEVRERFENGALVWRAYRRLDGKPAGTIAIEYRGGMRGLAPPDTIVLTNAWFGYTLTITTLPRS
jgi:Protein of unknown function (DUF3261)